jgi:hypothetical protein
MGIIDKKTGSDHPSIDVQISAYVELLRSGKGVEDGLSFDEITHRYTVNGHIIPSVTQVLKSCGLSHDFSNIDPWYAQRGTYVHTATEMWENGSLDEGSLAPNLVPYLEAYKAFRRYYTVPVLQQEITLYHPTYFYAGTIDMVVDDKRHYKLFLKDTGVYKLIEVNNIRDNLNVFLSALNVMRWKQKYLKEENHG